MPRVSILTATRNRAHWLKQLIDSVLAQTYGDWEMVIVDNASTDETAELVRSYGRGSPNKFQCLRQESNIGWSPGIALAAAHATGEFFLMIGDDDLLMPSILARELREFEANDALALVYSNMWLGAQPFVEMYYPAGYAGPQQRPLTVKEFVNAPRAPGTTTQSALFRRQAYDAVGGLNLAWRFFADLNLWFQITTRFPVTYVDCPLAFFRRHSGSSTAMELADVLEEEFKYWRQIGSRSSRDDGKAIFDYLTRQRVVVALHRPSPKSRAGHWRKLKYLWEALKCSMKAVTLAGSSDGPWATRAMEAWRAFSQGWLRLALDEPSQREMHHCWEAAQQSRLTALMHFSKALLLFPPRAVSRGALAALAELCLGSAVRKRLGRLHRLRL